MNILDRYILKKFLSILIFGLFALCIIFMIVDLMENMDNFIDEKATVLIIAKYYLNFFPEIIKLLMPVAVLISTLFSIGRLSVLNEITAMKTGGLSLYRMMVPLSILCLLLSLGQLYFNGWIVPISNQKKAEIERKYLHKSTGNRQIYNLYFRDNPNRNVIMQFYDSEQKYGTKIAIEDYVGNIKPRLVSRIEAEKITWDSIKKIWNLKTGKKFNFAGDGASMSLFDSSNIELKITNRQLARLNLKIDEMNFDEVKDYIATLELGGKDVRRQEIEYYGEYAYPFANFIVILFGVPFASVRKKGGIAIQIGAAMIISFLYLVFTKIGQTIGISFDLPPIVVGWSANVIFLCFGLINIFKTKT
ncbi:MAG: YjgP/YjgQ family permease [Ignavibacteria bacterium]|nr:YjgP/YjgQ family permease [Ignavibacteria bacterium]